MTTKKEKWNRLYTSGNGDSKPAAVLLDNIHLLPAGGVALDLACGLGANSLYLAGLGWQVHSWDISDVAINVLTRQSVDAGLDIQARVVDISSSTFVDTQFDLVVVCHYLDRSIIPALAGAIRPGGMICYQTFTRDKQLDIGPSNPDFLLGKEELKSFFADWETLSYQDASDCLDPTHPLAGRACIIACKPLR